MSRTRQAGLLALAIAGWLTCTAAQVEKYLPLRTAAVVCLLGCGFVAMTMLVLRWSYRRGIDLPRWALVAQLALIVLSFAVLYPKSLHHDGIRKGSDREDALRVELVAVVHHHYPYDARTFRNNPPTPLPGALWLASPFFFAGRIALQNLLWITAFMLFLDQFFRRRNTVFTFVLLFLITALENLNEFDVGGDYVVNFLYIAVAVFLFTRTVDKRGVSWPGFFAVTLLGVALSSRVLYVVVLFPLLAYAWQRTSPRRTFVLFAGVLTASAMSTLPVFWPHPIRHLLAQLAQNADKFQALPGFLPGKALAVLAVLTACVSLFIPVTLARVYLISGIATLIMILPPMAGIVAAQGGLTHLLSTDIEYLSVSVLFLALWIFTQWEGDLPLRERPALGRPPFPRPPARLRPTELRPRTISPASCSAHTRASDRTNTTRPNPAQTNR